MDRFSVDKITVDPALISPAIQQMVRHASMRHFDRNKPLPEGLLTVLVAAGQSASTSSNLQLWSVVAVTDPERKRTIAHLVDDQEFINDAPLFLLFCADSYRNRWLTAKQGYKFGSDYLDHTLACFVDPALACQNVALAAESLGLGICYIGNVRNAPYEISALLGLPQHVAPVVGLCVGWPTQEPEVKPRLPQSVVLHREQYSTETLEEGVKAYDAIMAKTGIYGDRRVRVPGVTPEPDKDTAHYGWMEHTARRMQRGQNERRQTGRFLKERGFPLE